MMLLKVPESSIGVDNNFGSSTRKKPKVPMAACGEYDLMKSSKEGKKKKMENGFFSLAAFNAILTRLDVSTYLAND